MEGYITDSTTIITSVGLAILGSGGVVGIMFWFLRRYLEKLLNEKEKEAEKRESLRKEKIQIEEELYHCTGRVIFWFYRYVMTGQHNGELDDAFRDFETAEEKRKAFDRKIRAESKYF